MYELLLDGKMLMDVSLVAVGVLGRRVPVTPQHPLGRQQTLHPHRPARVDATRRDPNLGAKTQAETVRKPRGTKLVKVLECLILLLVIRLFLKKDKSPFADIFLKQKTVLKYICSESILICTYLCNLLLEIFGEIFV